MPVGTPTQNLWPAALTDWRWIGDPERRASTPKGPVESSRFCEFGSAIAHAARTAGVMTEVNFILTDVVFAIDFLIRNVKPGVLFDSN